MIHGSFCLSHCPPHLNQDSNDILLLDFSDEVDSNQNCIKGNSFLTSCAPDWRASPQTENPFSSAFGYFPTPDSDPFRDDPLSKSPGNPHVPLANANGSANKTILNGSLNGDSEHLSQQINGLSSETMILALSNGQWPLGGKITQCNSISMMDGNEAGPVLSSKNPFLDSSLQTPPACNGVARPPQPPATPSKDSVVINPPPQSAKAGRGRRNAKVTLHGRTRGGRTACGVPGNGLTCISPAAYFSLLMPPSPAVWATRSASDGVCRRVHSGDGARPVIEDCRRGACCVDDSFLHALRWWSHASVWLE